MDPGWKSSRGEGSRAAAPRSKSGDLGSRIKERAEERRERRIPIPDPLFRRHGAALPNRTLPRVLSFPASRLFHPGCLCARSWTSASGAGGRYPQRDTARSRKIHLCWSNGAEEHRSFPPCGRNRFAGPRQAEQAPFDPQVNGAKNIPIANHDGRSRRENYSIRRLCSLRIGNNKHSIEPVYMRYKPIGRNR